MDREKFEEPLLAIICFTDDISIRNLKMCLLDWSGREKARSVLSDYYGNRRKEQDEVIKCQRKLKHYQEEERGLVAVT